MFLALGDPKSFQSSMSSKPRHVDEGSVEDGVDFYGIPNRAPVVRTCSRSLYEIPVRWHLQISVFEQMSCWRMRSRSVRELQNDQLEIIIVPGPPYHLTFSVTPPTTFENGFVINPIVQLLLLDVADNVCSDLNTFASLSIFPNVHRLYGQTTPVVSGVASFDRLRIVGDHDTSYTLRFDIIATGLSIVHFPYQIVSCKDIKPNSHSDRNGSCACLLATQKMYVPQPRVARDI